MRDPHCIQCGKLITHFGKGWKFDVVKRHGGYYHAPCWTQHVNRPRKIISPETRRIENQKYYQKHKAQMKLDMIQYYINNRESHIKNTRRWALEHPERKRSISRNWAQKKRLEMKNG